MYKLVAFGEVEDLEKWEKGFRTHGELFKKQTIKSPINFGVSENSNKIAIIFELEDLDKFFEILKSKETEDAIKNDGYKKESVKVIVIDKEFEY